jgi:ABC-2 type transport system permease protein
MRSIGLIIKREYLTAVKTKAFVFTTILLPLVGIGFFVMIMFLVNHQPNKTFRLAIVDEAGGLASSVAKGLDSKLPDGHPQFTVVQSVERPDSDNRAQDQLRAQINSGALDAYLVIPADLKKPVELHTRNPGDFSLQGPLLAAVNRAIILQRLNARGIHVDDASALTRGADLELVKITKSGETVEKGQSVGVAIALVLLLYLSLLIYGILMMRSVLEEKTTRTMEVLISSVKPFDLLTGKILGVAATAFTQLAIWIVSLLLLLTYGAAMAASMGPNSPFSGVHIPASLIVYAGIFFVGGYFLYSAMFAAIGAACASEHDAQQLQWLAMAPLVFTICIYGLVLGDPASSISIVLSEIPFFAPVLMPLRISLQTPPFWQIGLSIVLLFATTIGAIWASAKVYRIGVLMYGKRPTLPELARWLRYS